MGKIQGLTQEQESVLARVGQDEYLKKTYYFTGGTALSSVYLNHRISEDIDLFSQNPTENQILLNTLETWAKEGGFEIIASRFVEVVYIFNLKFKNNLILKVDFGYYPYKRLGKARNIDGVDVDSLLDIAINKLFTVSNRTEVKDFVDLYFLLQKFTISDLIEGVRVKFNRKVDPLLLAADFFKVHNFTALPQMIKPLTLTDLKTFFVNKARMLGLEEVEKKSDG